MTQQTQITKREMARVTEIDQKLGQLRHTYKPFIEIYNQVDRKIKGIELEIKILEEERLKLLQGQLVFDADF